jgi:hypothetical protein
MAHLLFAPEKPWKRKPPHYDETHRKLRAECEANTRAPRRHEKRDRHIAASELYKILGDTP